jgi:hypothetical protein
MKKSPLPYFTRLLQQEPKDEGDKFYYDTNKHLARDIGIRTFYENLGCNFWDLVEEAPKDLYNKKCPSTDVSLDILWAEKQLQIAFDLA